jgi:hypothetical protein
MHSSFKRDYYSQVELESICRTATILRNFAGLREDEKIDVVRFVEFEVPKIVDGFELIVEADSEFESDILALARACPPQIVVRESVYKSAVGGFPTARLILAHELGHLFCRPPEMVGDDLHFDVSWDGDELNPDELFCQKAEWHADEFAAEFLTPSAIAIRLSAEEIKLKFGVSQSFARNRLSTLTLRQDELARSHAPYDLLFEAPEDREDIDISNLDPFIFGSYRSSKPLSPA